MFTYGKYIIIGYSYYKLGLESYDMYRKGKFIADIFFPKKNNKETKIIIIKEDPEGEFLIIA